ncbi:hypothetical protein C2W62_15675 [Candidatus Entotheonella serta]|nr:hypothetical protein C2W62_15675 [Candidatus Entotheonella serta]
MLFLVDGEEVNRETSAPYGDRRNNHENFFQWRDTTRYGAGKHKMTVRIASTGEENSVTVDMAVPGVDPNAPITQTLRDGDRIGPGAFEWQAMVKADNGAVVVFFIDGEEVNRETSAPYGDRRNNHENFFQWRDTARYGAGRHKMTVRIASTGEENSVTVNMVER